MTGLSQEQLRRYNRHIVLKDIGLVGQTRILESRVLIIGVGGLGSSAALYLAAAGVGTLGIVDGDKVDISNLQRQVIHFTEDIEVNKVDSAARKMKALNPDIKINTYTEYATAENILKIILNYDFVIDGTDNFSSKFLINDACVLAKIPYSHGGVLRFHGEALTVIPGKTACYRCVFDEPPPAGAVPGTKEVGVLGSTAGMLGTIQATEALKYLAETGGLLTDQFFTFNTKEMDFRKIKIKRQKNCPVCGDAPKIKRLTD